MSLYKLYKVDLDMSLVVAVEKEDINVQTAIERSVINHIEDIMEHQIDEDSLDFSEITSCIDLPYGWGEYMLPYHRYKDDPDSILGLDIGDILKSNKAEKIKEHMDEKFLLNKIAALEAQVEALKQQLQ